MKVQTQELYAPESYWKLSLKEKETICNGCGVGSAMFDFVPNGIYGLDISEACNIHDYMYHKGKTIEDKLEADRVFVDNLIRIINKNTSWKWLRNHRRRVAHLYYDAVSMWGGPAYWEGKNNSNNLKVCFSKGTT